MFRTALGRAYDQGKALNAATVFELDDVIDPADTRRWIVTALRETPSHRARQRTSTLVAGG